MRGERKLFDSRREARAGQKSQLQERVAQLAEQIDGTKLQAAAKADEIDLIASELVGVQELWKKNLVPITRVNSLKREETRLRGERGQLISTIAQAKGKISETELQIMQIEQDLRSEVSTELREVQAKIAELVERKVAADDQLKRIDIRAPQDGIVHQSTVHTVGGVIGAGRSADARHARGRQAVDRGQGRAPGYRPAPAGTRHGPAAVRLQPAHDTRDQGPGHAHRRRPRDGRAQRHVPLPGQDRHRGGAA